MAQGTFPRVSAYLKGLPKGLESYPECKAKGAAMRNFMLGAVPPERLTGLDLPAPILSLLHEPPLNSDWVPEVSMWATLIAVREILGFDDDSSWIAWSERRNTEALNSLVLRLVMKFTSVDLFLPLCGPYWGMLHKGSQLSVAARASHSATFALEYPPGLFNEELSSTLLVVAFRIPLVLANAKDPVLTLASWSPTRATFEGKWS
ncbi:MAG: hypothetical protein HY901_18435 [Deltaproteobacteria bacterium]|nr:hypothetical protein [Deltaproteobacteria bacterium]